MNRKETVFSETKIVTEERQENNMQNNKNLR